jgi:hypothetical protein
VHPPLPAGGDDAGAFAAALAEELRAHPEQWCVLYPVHEAGREAHDPKAAKLKGAASP